MRGGGGEFIYICELFFLLLKIQNHIIHRSGNISSSYAKVNTDPFLLHFQIQLYQSLQPGVFRKGECKTPQLLLKM